MSCGARLHAWWESRLTGIATAPVLSPLPNRCYCSLPSVRCNPFTRRQLASLRIGAHHDCFGDSCEKMRLIPHALVGTSSRRLTLLRKEQRRTPRYTFIASAELIEEKTDVRIATRVSELSL